MEYRTLKGSEHRRGAFHKTLERIDLQNRVQQGKTLKNSQRLREILKDSERISKTPKDSERLSRVEPHTA